MVLDLLRRTLTRYKRKLLDRNGQVGSVPAQATVFFFYFSHGCMWLNSMCVTVTKNERVHTDKPSYYENGIVLDYTRFEWTVVLVPLCTMYNCYKRTVDYGTVLYSMNYHHGWIFGTALHYRSIAIVSFIRLINYTIYHLFTHHA